MTRFKIGISLVFAALTFLSFINGTSTPEVGLEIGDTAPRIQTQLLDGESFDLEAYRGKMVLLNFWASYDAQSRMNNFQLNRIQTMYQGCEFSHGRDIVVVSISLDRFKSPLNQAIRQDETESFNHICDYLGIKGEIAKLYAISEPVNILLDGQGRILVKDKQYNKLEKSLSFLELK